MSESDTKPVAESSPVQPTPSDPMAGLQRQLQNLMIAVLVVSGTLCLVLLSQARYAKRDLQMIQGPANQIIQSFKQEKPMMDNFINKVAEYGKTHSDIQPLLQKYGVQMTNTSPATSAAPKAVSAPAAPASK